MTAPAPEKEVDRPTGNQSLRPLVTVVMPAYNAAATIQAAIDSVLSQTAGNLELLIGDDASSDSTVELLSGLTDPRIRVLKNAKNRGPGATRDRLIAEATGEWITFCDADDTWKPERLATLLAAAEGAIDTVIFDDLMECHSVAGEMVPWKRLRGPDAFGAYGKAVRIDTVQLIDSKRMLMQPMFSRALLIKSGAYHSQHAYGEDSFFLMKLLAGGGDLIYVPSALYLYRITPGSASKHSHRYSLLREALEATLGDFDGKPTVQAALQRKIAKIHKAELYSPFINAVKEKRVVDAMRLFAKHPSLIREFLVRSMSDLPYHLHRLRHGGLTRGSK